jgi:acetyltransferase
MNPSNPVNRPRGVQQHSLESLFNPRTIAVIGATEREGSVGRAVLENLKVFGGAVYPVNPKRPTVLGLRAYPSLPAINAEIDLAIIVTPAAAVPGVVDECVRAGVKSAIILSAGFKETGAEGTALEREILEIAGKGGMRIIGPNCLGVMAPHAGLNATFASTMARAGNIAFISQSGALCTAILGWSFRRKLGFSAFVSVGSMLDVNWGDLIYHLGDDPKTHSIVIYMESIGDARGFLSAAREVAFTKPIIVIKIGRSEAAASAAASHTGALTGSDEVLDAAFRRVGVLRVETIEDLFELADVVAKQPLPKGPRLSIVTNAGGPGALATDMLVGTGGQLAPLSPECIAKLSSFLPAPWSHGNPIDILGDADEKRYAAAVEVAVAEPNSDGVLVILTPQAMTNPLTTAEAMRPFARTSGKPVLTSWMGGADVDSGRHVLIESGLPIFDYPDMAARAFSYMWRRAENLRTLYETPILHDPDDDRGAREKTSAVVNAALAEGRTLLSEFEAKAIVASYGIPVVETRVALQENDAVSEADKLGYPVAVKLHSETITHKTDVGGVHLNVADAGAVRLAWRAIEKAVSERAGRQHFLGVTVQQMVPRSGYELILGSSVDPQFGPVLLFGAGGELVEVFKDRALALPPLTANLAKLVIRQTRIHKALLGVRGKAPIDMGALEQLLVRFSRLVAENPRIKEIDINPLLASEKRIIALDARVILHDPSVKDADLPKLAIRPYPFEYISQQRLKDGTPVTVRPIRAEDEPLMVDFHHSLSTGSVYSRYFEFLHLEQRIAHERLARICFIDYDREIALVAEDRDPQNGKRRILGVGRLIKDPNGDSGEFALLIGDPWQGQGLGTLLMGLVVGVARTEGLKVLTGDILGDNAGMKEIARKAGFLLRHPNGETTIRAELEL